jgi:hypothetical protein
LPAGSHGMPNRSGAVVYRQHPEAPARPGNMVAQRVDAQHPVIQHTPAASVRTERSSAFGSSAPAAGAASHRTATEAPRTSPGSSSARAASSSPSQPAATRGHQTSDWSGGAKPAASSQSQSTPRTSQAAPAASRAPDQWKQGTRAAPGYRSDTGLPAYYSAQHPAQTSSGAPLKSSGGQSSEGYYPKSYHQAAEIHSLPHTDQHESTSPSSPASSSGSRSGSSSGSRKN